MKKKLSGIFVLIGILCVALSAYLYFLIFGAEKYETTDINDYGKYMECGKGSLSESVMYVFPNQVPDSAENVTFYYYFRDLFLDPEVQMFLECQYDKLDFEAEVRRISEKAKEESTERDFYNLTDFKYPAYVFRLGDDSKQHYALLLEKEFKIVYVYTSFVPNRHIKFCNDYLPKHYSVET